MGLILIVVKLMAIIVHVYCIHSPHVYSHKIGNNLVSVLSSKVIVYMVLIYRHSKKKYYKNQ